MQIRIRKTGGWKEKEKLQKIKMCMNKYTEKWEKMTKNRENEEEICTRTSWVFGLCPSSS
jgi:hypothetical protein